MWAGILSIPPLISWYLDHFPSVHAQLPVWVGSVSLGLWVGLGVMTLIANAVAHANIDRLLRDRQLPRIADEAPSKSPTPISPALQQPEAVPAPALRAKGWTLPSHARVFEAVGRLRRDRPSAEWPKVKIVTSTSGRSVAELLVLIFQTAEWRLEDNPEDGSYIFRAKSDQITNIKIRYRKAFADIGSDVGHALNVMYFLETQTEQFPDLDVAYYSFIQIEIGYPS
jgi:hypothetical protein